MVPKVLLLDPDKSRSKSLASSLGADFHVMTGSDPDLTIALLGSLRPWAVVLSCEQTSRDGFSWAHSMRRRLPVGSCLLVVYGDESATVPPWVDVYLPGDEVDGAQLASVLCGTLMATTPISAFDLEEDAEIPESQAAVAGARALTALWMRLNTPLDFSFLHKLRRESHA